MDGDATETRLLHWATVGLAAAAIYVCWPLLPPLILAAWTAALTHPLLLRFEHGLNGKRRASAALVMLLFLLVSVPLALVLIGVASGAQEIVQLVVTSPSAKSALEAIAGGNGTPLPAWPTTLPSVIALLQQYGSQGIGILTKVAGAATAGVVALMIYFGGTFAFLADGPNVARWIRRHMPLAPAHLERFTAAFQETGRGLLIGVGLTSATQGVVASLIYLSLGVPRWWVLGPITGLASMIPVAGSSLVWAPVAIGLWLTGHAGQAAILAVLGVGVIGAVDNVLQPIYARVGALRMPLFLLLVSVFGGLAAFGAWGAILGPLIVRLALEALALRREAADAAVVSKAQ